jgi:hypothetical protein
MERKEGAHEAGRIAKIKLDTNPNPSKTRHSKGGMKLK